MAATAKGDEYGSSSKFKKAYSPSGEIDKRIPKRPTPKALLKDDNIEPKLSFKFRDQNIKLTNDRLTALGFKGWASIFSTHCASSGNWYFEVEIDSNDPSHLKFVGNPVNVLAGKTGHVRIGYACRYQRYDTPIGINKSGFSISDVDGAVVFNSKKHEYSRAFGPGDVIGCFLSLQEPTTEFVDPRINLKLYEFLQNGILCDPRNPPLCNLNHGSYVQFSINGEMGEKLNIPIHDGFYHPGISLYMGTRITANFGPEFQYPPEFQYRPCIEMTKPIY
ncbi:bifunctional Histone methyltransferase complex subunit ASH2/Concanavalin A-like lectin-glucanase domain superfamily/B30.2-SPRY domain superfamily/SPRY domain/B30.2-SPRY domain [Babesia duncani]|uniref:Bifunctional Histone methyltransferase complex subunit ASH2/Concanavalin A-like lectin-glucanase domain superfamily/B30.2-SPRY domain superfamily/SPRY domain/B30.2-SPRY domain n=1 Tax=Babesia duncani TaxID=323732 RepID=A0AAD9UNZ3_9APIC|nr:bifunctional Histone methyltransferase complex subunit ASH2/Concanavalin A-like lectin-glucanase domain superfamily/B30.2-SPRY domain superfamily/SPRY domain/B30.2-SPRY domain [Babesia duncani]